MQRKYKGAKILTLLLIFIMLFSLWSPSIFATEDEGQPGEDQEEAGDLEEVIDEEVIEEGEPLGPVEEPVDQEEQENPPKQAEENKDNDEGEIEDELAEDIPPVMFSPFISAPIVKSSSGGGLEDTIAVDKWAERLLGLCRVFEVNLKITGTPQEAPVDVVLVIDKSGSMNEKSSFSSYSRLYYAKEAAVNFAAKVLGDGGIPGSRVSLVTFSGPSSTTGNGAQSQAQTVRGLTNNLNQLTNDINGITAIGGTNTEAGFLQGRSVIENSDNPNSNKVVIMFTDGLPTASNGNRYAESTDINHIHNQRALEAGKGIYQDGVADVFTIGLLQGMNTAERNLALQILQQTQNKGWYEAPTAQDLDQIFDEISNQLGYAATNAKVIDKIGDNFELVEGSLPAGATYNSSTREISWNPGTIYEEASLTYQVKAKPEIAGEHATNEYAKLTYTDIFGTAGKEKIFPVPKVEVPTLLEVNLTDANIILGDSINLGIGADSNGENYMNITGGDGNGTYTYEWRVKDNSTIISTDKNPAVSPEEDTIYELTVIDSNGCKAVATMKVKVGYVVTIRKEIKGNYADLERDFDFTVSINDEEQPSFSLVHEGEKEFRGIPKGSTIELKEENADGYTVTVEVGDQVYSPEDGVYTISDIKESITITVTNYKETEVDVGISLDSLPYILILTMAVGGLGITVVRRRKIRD
ncbi:MAG TPA: VWA domain-containing protein [Eubacteriaceae bacterium]|nr:VWA domain-containing protein [Eubacteriaceae bacterium]